MLKLTDVTEDNWIEAASLTVKDSQKGYAAPVIGILARGYVYRGCGAKVFLGENDGIIVGAALVREFTEEPLGYDLQQFVIGREWQGKGFGSEMLEQILRKLRVEKHYDHVEVCVKKANTAAIGLFTKHGFTDSGYIDPDVPDSVNMICRLF